MVVAARRQERDPPSQNAARARRRRRSLLLLLLSRVNAALACHGHQEPEQGDRQGGNLGHFFRSCSVLALLGADGSCELASSPMLLECCYRLIYIAASASSCCHGPERACMGLPLPAAAAAGMDVRSRSSRRCTLRSSSIRTNTAQTADLRYCMLISARGTRALSSDRRLQRL